MKLIINKVRCFPIAAAAAVMVTTRVLKITAVLCAFFLIVTLPAASFANDGESASSWVIEFLLVWVLPLIILLAIWVFIFRKLYFKRYRGYMARAEVHMERVEQLLERIAKAVEQK